LIQPNSQPDEDLMGFADLHIHTVHSWDGTATVPAILKHAADATDLDVIAICDHDCIRGGQEAIQLAPRYGI
jgi:predicted metal-dependent phosphoesterase TrpH